MRAYLIRAYSDSRRHCRAFVSLSKKKAYGAICRCVESLLGLDTKHDINVSVSHLSQNNLSDYN